MGKARRGGQDVYTGKSGQMAVMAELLHRGCNVAVPEVDVGEDVFAFRDGREEIARLQVKTANARPLKTADAYAAQVSLPAGQLHEADSPRLYYVFAIRRGRYWEDFIVISRSDLSQLRLNRSLGSEHDGHVKLDLSFRKDDVNCSGVSLQRFRNAWEVLPPLQGAVVPSS